jgi:hypothetical protein
VVSSRAAFQAPRPRPRRLTIAPSSSSRQDHSPYSSSEEVSRVQPWATRTISRQVTSCSYLSSPLLRVQAQKDRRVRQV